MFALPISKPRFKSIIFNQNSPKMKLFLQKNAKFSSAGAPPPDPQNSPPIANFWLRAWIKNYQIETVEDTVLDKKCCWWKVGKRDTAISQKWL